MIITYHGFEFFKVQFGGTTLALNPISKKSKHKATRFGADVVLVSIDHADTNGVDTVSRGDKEPFVISGPGEYGVQDIFVRGFGTKTSYDKKTHNTVYLVRMEDMQLCYLGALSVSELPKELTEALEEVDVLFVPLGGNGVLSSKDAHKLAVQLEPKVIIPMHYTDKELKAFLKEEGGSTNKPIDKLTLKKKDLTGKSGEVVVLSAV